MPRLRFHSRESAPFSSSRFRCFWTVPKEESSNVSRISRWVGEIPWSSRYSRMKSRISFCLFVRFTASPVRIKVKRYLLPNEFRPRDHRGRSVATGASPSAFTSGIVGGRKA